MPSTKTLIQSQTIGATEDADLLWIWDNSAAELDKITLGNLFAANQTFALLNGRSGGQALIGGTAANDDLTLEGTSSATRTTSYVILQPNGGNVGIGTTSPYSKLFVAGGELFVDFGTGGVSNGGAFRLATSASRAFISSNNYFDGSSSRYTRTGGAGLINFDTSTTATAGDIYFNTYPSGGADSVLPSPNTAMIIKQAGNVGIGTTSPARTLHVAGTILIDGDEGGFAGTIGLTDGFDLAARSTGVGRIMFNDATNRDSSGFVKIYIGVTEYYIPVFAAI